MYELTPKQRWLNVPPSDWFFAPLASASPEGDPLPELPSLDLEEVIDFTAPEYCLRVSTPELYDQDLAEPSEIAAGSNAIKATEVRENGFNPVSSELVETTNKLRLDKAPWPEPPIQYNTVADWLIAPDGTPFRYYNGTIIRKSPSVPRLENECEMRIWRRKTWKYLRSVSRTKWDGTHHIRLSNGKLIDISTIKRKPSTSYTDTSSPPKKHKMEERINKILAKGPTKLHNIAKAYAMEDTKSVIDNQDKKQYTFKQYKPLPEPWAGSDSSSDPTAAKPTSPPALVIPSCGVEDEKVDEKVDGFDELDIAKQRAALNLLEEKNNLASLSNQNKILQQNHDDLMDWLEESRLQNRLEHDLLSENIQLPRDIQLPEDNEKAIAGEYGTNAEEQARIWESLQKANQERER
ncbi:hypothetical protein B0J11DRAFT_579491 [Dendryphion nanum]|uniref:Uncharacterized protein n=1 Tax=Dendryphion nanum TaxID=256645 RepID=A0A9P9DZ31_9PLEO|nr:hypothetical protein B0J11DRAFT_579491 [Dendryphion nanum]